MRIVKQSYEIESDLSSQLIIDIERYGRTCYKSEDRELSLETAKKFVAMLIKRGHHSVLEHGSATVRFVCDRGVSHEIVRHRLASYCISGDTEVVAYRKSNATASSQKKWTVEKLYSWQSDKKRKGRLKLIRLRSMDDNGRLVPGKIKEILYSGKQPTFVLSTASGRKIRATASHRIATKQGYVPLGDLRVGDRVWANGLSALENKEWLEKKYLLENNTLSEMALLAGCCTCSSTNERTSLSIT